MASDNEIAQLYNPLYQRFNYIEQLAKEPVLLAHYTSVFAVEKILQQEELWFSNPLFMNDWEEMRFGLHEGLRLFMDPNRLMRVGKSKERVTKLEQHFHYFWKRYEEEGAFDTYVFCLSQHKRDDNDGLLSMWRGYGGHGKGAAIIFDPSKIPVVPGSPLTFAKVSYATTPDRLATLNLILDEWAKISESADLNEDQLPIAAYQAFAVIKMYALSTKHIGFVEECEWRVVYIPDYDTKKILTPSLGYFIGQNGVEPKLKYKFGTIAGVTADGLKLEEIVDRIILGPAISSQLASMSFRRMLEKIDRKNLVGKVAASTIPLRAS